MGLLAWPAVVFLLGLCVGVSQQSDDVFPTYLPVNSTHKCSRCPTGYFSDESNEDCIFKNDTTSQPRLPVCQLCLDGQHSEGCATCKRNHVLIHNGCACPKDKIEDFGGVCVRAITIARHEQQQRIRKTELLEKCKESALPPSTPEMKMVPSPAGIRATVPSSTDVTSAVPSPADASVYPACNPSQNVGMICVSHGIFMLILVIGVFSGMVILSVCQRIFPILQRKVCHVNGANDSTRENGQTSIPLRNLDSVNGSVRQGRSASSNLSQECEDPLLPMNTDDRTEDESGHVTESSTPFATGNSSHESRSPQSSDTHVRANSTDEHVSNRTELNRADEASDNSTGGSNQVEPRSSGPSASQRAGILPSSRANESSDTSTGGYNQVEPPSSGQSVRRRTGIPPARYRHNRQVSIEYTSQVDPIISRPTCDATLQESPSSRSVERLSKQAAAEEEYKKAINSDGPPIEEHDTFEEDCPQGMKQRNMESVSQVSNGHAMPCDETSVKEVGGSTDVKSSSSFSTVL